MKIDYSGLWKLLIDKQMKKKDLSTCASISPATIAKLAKSENVNTQILIKICKALDCDIADIAKIDRTDTEDYRGKS